ncbi:benzoate/H(+) symporter BenE family transporter [Phreatobacter oligotrophus]|uniref:Benzoate membrane transport protein n=1 Tax=Phreatobacter oligotrophus TaxID=1122261 RepID=A0A2T4YY54_9HYPH|nr:benzoate/H(+) symporter BenE family transporter [Phreatobacter oligotrophus]PTM51480.1 benzoate membrane transport protein [Phreatobacter oligotrophus]
MTPFEPLSPNRPTLSEIRRDIGPVQLLTGLVAFLFGATGALAIILAVGTGGGLKEAELASFVFGVFAINGALTVALVWLYRQPLCLFWTIPGTVLIGPALTHMSFAEVVGAFWVTSLLVLALGWTGLARRVMQLIPMPIVMAMVAGVFLKFAIDVVRSLHGDFAIAGAMVAAFFGLSVWPAAQRYIPPIIGALLAGAVVAGGLGRFAGAEIGGLALVQPVFTMPIFSWRAMIELVVPIAITIVFVQHGQGLAVLTQAGHKPPLTAVTIFAGIGGLLSAAVGAVGTALTGPTNGLITSTGPRERHYATAIVTAVIAIGFGLLAPTFTRLMLAAPKELILTLGGLAMLRVLLGAFTVAFKGPFAFGALVCFVVTVADMPVMNIGAAFWGLVAGLAASWLMERADFARAA